MPTSSFGRRRLTAIAISVALTAGALAVGGGPAIGATVAEPTETVTGSSAIVIAPEDVLSHFLCYAGRFDRFAKNPEVGLKDQFGNVTANVGRAVLFCNPAKKKRGRSVTPIVSVRQHLKGYAIFAPTTIGTRDIEVTNQFGPDQSLQISKSPFMTLVPTRKRPHRRPRGLDHFLCYSVTTGKSINARVKLTDQFRRYKRARVLDPVLHCNPVEKTHGKKTTSIQHREAHLVCYNIKPRKLDPPRKRWTANQFERSFVKAKLAVVLCVPSTKQLVP